MTIEALDVFGWLGPNPPAPTEGDLALMERVVGAVVAHIAHTHALPEPEDEEEPPPDPEDWTQAHIIAAARLWQRKKSPAGIIDLGEMGGIRVNALDRDVEQLLSPYKTFAIG